MSQEPKDDTINPYTRKPYPGEALDLHIPASNSTVSMRRFDQQINFGVVGPVAMLNADEAEEIGRALILAARLARGDDDIYRDYTP